MNDESPTPLENPMQNKTWKERIEMFQDCILRVTIEHAFYMRDNNLEPLEFLPCEEILHRACLRYISTKHMDVSSDFSYSENEKYVTYRITGSGYSMEVRYQKDNPVKTVEDMFANIVYIPLV